MAATNYTVKQFQSSKELENFLNTGSSVTAGTQVSSAKIITINFDPGNGRFFIVLAPNY